jgi:hypothetical protein
MEAVETLPDASMDALYGDRDEDGRAADDPAGAMAPMPGGDGAAIGDIRICARTFDEFIYRFWLEDEIAWKLGDRNQVPLTDIEHRYLDHYQQQPNGMG